MKEQDIMNHFVSAIVMGKEIFEIYQEKAKDQKLKLIIGDFIESFANQKENLVNELQTQGYEIEEDYSILQKNAIMMEKVKTKILKDDYELGINIINTMASAIKGALKYYRKCNISTKIKFKKNIKEIMVNYENIIGKIKTYLINTI